MRNALPHRAQLRVVVAIIRAVVAHESPKLPRMVEFGSVAKLVNNHVVDHFARKKEESQIECDVAAARATRPAFLLMPNHRMPITKP